MVYFNNDHGENVSEILVIKAATKIANYFGIYLVINNDYRCQSRLASALYAIVALLLSPQL